MSDERQLVLKETFRDKSANDLRLLRGNIATDLGDLGAGFEVVANDMPGGGAELVITASATMDYNVAHTQARIAYDTSQAFMGTDYWAADIAKAVA